MLRLRPRAALALLLCVLCVLPSLPARAGNLPGGIRLVVDGQLRTLDPPAVVTGGVIMVPKGPILAILGRELTIPQPPSLTDSPDMVPLDSISQAVGARVGWNDYSKTVYLWTARHLTGSLGSLSPEGRLAAGADFALAVREDGTVWKWGRDAENHPENGLWYTQAIPAQVPGLTDIVTVSARNGNALALRKDGTVWAWIYSGNAAAQVPKQVPGLADVRAVNAGANFSLALGRDGTVWVWGANLWGEFGTASGGYVTTPVQVPGVSGITAVAAGHSHVLALAGDGTVWTWGNNEKGALGDGTTQKRTAPQRVPGLTDVVRIAAGDGVSFAIKRDGSVLGWGDNVSHRIGPADDKVIPRPVQVQKENGSFPDTVAIAAGNAHTVLLEKNGAAWTWGMNTNHVLGHPGIPYQGQPDDPYDPRPLLPGLKVVAAAVGAYATYLFTENGELWAVGSNESGQLGDGTLTSPADYALNPLRLHEEPGSPTLVKALPASGATDFATSGTASLDYDRMIAPGPAFAQIGLTDGSGNSVQVKASVMGSHLLVTPARSLSKGTAYRLQVPTGAVADLTGHPAGTADVIAFTTTAEDMGIGAIAAGSTHSLVVQKGQVWAFGLNTAGQLGTTGVRNSVVPVIVPGLTDVVAVTARFDRNLAITKDGRVWSWGGATSLDPAPRQVKGLPPARAAALGLRHALVLTTEGNVWAWGANDHGQLATREVARTDEPREVAGLSDVIAIAAGDRMSAALKADGTLWYWGGLWGPTKPRRIPGLTDVVWVTIYGDRILAVRRDGTVWTYERRLLLQVEDLTGVAAILIPGQHFGDGGMDLPDVILKQDGTVWNWTQAAVNSPDKVLVQVQGLHDITAIAGGDTHWIALQADGTAWVWGKDDRGQLGDGAYQSRSNPIRLTLPRRQLP